ncbi:MAG: GntR family transcriptional regulator [Methylobacter sp.]|nr:MAG: GntR family transcriptional regulator [Methylobacter sp.]
MLTPKNDAAQSIYLKLRGMILNFEIQPNSRLTETELANYFEVSRTPIREALQRLEAEGLIMIRPKQGCFVRAMDLDEFSEYYQIRISLEMLSLENACTNMSDEALKKLAQVWGAEPLSDADDNGQQVAALDESFHLALANGGGNRILVKLLSDINNRIRIVRRWDFTDRERIQKTYQEHLGIINHLLKRDLVSAKSDMARHIKKSEEFTKMLTVIHLGMKKSNAFPFSDAV